MKNKDVCIKYINKVQKNKNSVCNPTYACVRTLSWLFENLYSPQTAGL